MDIVRIPPSRIVEIGLIAFSTPEVDYLCFGESDQPSPAGAHAAAKAALDAGITRYVDVRGLPALRGAIATYLSGIHAKPVAEDRIQLAASGMAAISIAMAAIVRAGDRVVLHSPAWPNVGNAARLRGAEVVELDLIPRPDGSFRLDLDRLAALLPGTRAFVLNSPNNPTGWTATAAEIAAILDLCRRHGTWLIADEVYSRLVYDGSVAAPSVLDIATPGDRVMVANSFSKTWVMTGWRLGWLVVPQGLRETVSNIVEVTHSSVAPFIQHAGIAAIADTDVVQRFRDHCASGRALMADALAGLNGVRFTAPVGAFYAFVGIDGLTDSFALAHRLVTEHRVAVAPGIAFGAAGEGHLRICFAQSAATMARAAEKLRAGLR